MIFISNKSEKMKGNNLYLELVPRLGNCFEDDGKKKRKRFVAVHTNFSTKALGCVWNFGFSAGRNISNAIS
jgi:hypothetical protein